MAKPSWITLDKSSGTVGGPVKITAQGNPYRTSRSGTLTVKTASGLTKTVSLSQPGRGDISVIAGSVEGFLGKVATI